VSVGRAARGLFRLAPTAVALLVVWPAAAMAEPPGVIGELPAPTHVHDIAAGPHGELWFATSRSPRAVGWIAPRGQVHRFNLPKGEAPVAIIAARDGKAAWFSWNRVAKGKPILGGIARVTAGGAITHFQGPPDHYFLPHELVLGGEGDIWFNNIGISSAGENVIGRMTPAGKFKTFGAALTEDSWITGLAAGADGNVWFGNGKQGAVGRITPAGTITQFEAERSSPAPYIFPPAPGPGGSVYFGVEREGIGAGIGRVDPGGSSVSLFTAGLGPAVAEIGPVTVAHGDAWFGIGRRGPAGTTASPDGGVAIGRLSPEGSIREFSRCLRPALMPLDPTVGPEGDVWFLSGTPFSNDYLVSGLIRITPAGQITEFMDGIHPGYGLEDLVSAAGRLWFVDPDGGRIGELKPPRGKPNTVLVEFPYRHHETLIRVTTPGPGTVRIKETGVSVAGRDTPVPGLRTRRLRASACGPISTPLPWSGPLQSLFERQGHLRLEMTVTFTPSGGAPFSQRTGIKLVPG
jgi:virginiamycin B lyase